MEAGMISDHGRLHRHPWSLPALVLGLLGCLGTAGLPALGQGDPGGTTAMKPSKGVIDYVPTGAPFHGQALVLETPTQGAPILGTLPNGTEVTLGESSGWYIRITSPRVGYVGANLVRITESAPLNPDSRTEPTFEQVSYNSRPETRAATLRREGPKPFVPIPPGPARTPKPLADYLQRRRP